MAEKLTNDPWRKEKLKKRIRRIETRSSSWVERIKIARSGSFKNSEYEAAKDEQAFVEGQFQVWNKNSYAEIVNSDGSCSRWGSNR